MLCPSLDLPQRSTLPLLESKHQLPLASPIGQPIKLDEIISTQRILTNARGLVNIDLSKLKPNTILVELEGEKELRG